MQKENAKTSEKRDKEENLQKKSSPDKKENRDNKTETRTQTFNTIAPLIDDQATKEYSSHEADVSTKANFNDAVNKALNKTFSN